jgi:hypothetical protein
MSERFTPSAISRLWFVPFFAPLLALQPASANAAEEPLPARQQPAASQQPGSFTPFVKRRMVPPPKTLDPYIIPKINGEAGAAPRVGASLGATWGIAQGLALDIQTAPFYVSPGSGSDQHRVTLTGQLINTPSFQVGGSILTTLDTTEGPFFHTVQPGVPIIIGVSERLRIDTGAQVPVTSGKIGVRVPVTVAVQLTTHVHGAATSALYVRDIDDARATTTIPLGFTLGYSAGADQANLGVVPYFQFNRFYTPATGKVETGSFSGGVIVDVPVNLP